MDLAWRIDELYGYVREYIPANQRKTIARDYIRIAKEEGATEWYDETLLEEDADLSTAGVNDELEKLED